MRMMKRDVEKRGYGSFYQEERQQAPFIIISYLNTLHIRQKTTSESNINLNATIRIQQGKSRYIYIEHRISPGLVVKTTLSFMVLWKCS